MINYEKQNDPITGAEFIIRYNDDATVSYIPADLANADYQAYLAQLEAEAE